MQEFMRMIKKISVEKCSEDLVWAWLISKLSWKVGSNKGAQV